VSVSTDNKTNLLTNLDQHELYLISANSGYNQRYATFAAVSADPLNAAVASIRGAGAPFYFAPRDLGLNEGTVANSNKTLQITLEITVAPVSTVGPETCECQCNYIEDSFTQDNNSVFTSVRPVVSSEKLLQSPIMYTGEVAGTNQILGGSLFGWMKTLWNKGKQAVNDFAHSRAGENIAHAIQDAGTRAVSKGVELGTQALKTRLAAAARTGGKKYKNKRGGDAMNVGGDLMVSGGRKMSKAHLHQLLM